MVILTRMRAYKSLASVRTCRFSDWSWDVAEEARINMSMHRYPIDENGVDSSSSLESPMYWWSIKVVFVVSERADQNHIIGDMSKSLHIEYVVVFCGCSVQDPQS